MLYIMLKIKDLVLQQYEDKIIFSGCLGEKFFFGLGKGEDIEIINDYSFCEFEVEYILETIKEKLNK